MPLGRGGVGEVGWLVGWVNGTHMSDAVHGLNLVVESPDGGGEALPVGDDELVPEGSGHQHNVVVDEAAKKDALQVEGFLLLCKCLLRLCAYS